MIKIELAHVEGGNVYILGLLAPGAPADLAVSLQIGSAVHDLGGNVRRFPRRDRLTGGAAAEAILIAKPVEATARLAGRDVQLIVSSPGQAHHTVPVRLRSDEVAFRAMVLLHEPILRALLEQANRTEAYLLETDIWPEASEREEVADLVELSASVSLEIDFCCVPLPGMLVAVGFMVDPLGEVVAVDIFHGDEDMPFERRLRRFERLPRTPDPRNLRAAGGFVIVAEFDEAAVPHDDFVLLLAGRRRVWTRSLRPRARLERGLDVLAGHLANGDADTAVLVLEELAGQVGPRVDKQAGLRLFAMQVAAVEGLSTYLARPELGLRLAVDLATFIAGHGIFLLGWASLEPELVRGVELYVPTRSGGLRAAVSGNWVAHRRADVWQSLKDEGERLATDQLGYICVARTPGLEAPATACLSVHMADDSVRRLKLRLQFSALDPLEAIRPLLVAFPQTHLQLGELLDMHIGPAVTALWAQRRGRPDAPELTDYAGAVTNPECSLIVPLYGRFDLMEHQMARFADDPALRGQELIYVVDDPAIYEAVRLLAGELAQLYGMPFRLVHARANLGFAAATNLGAAVARGHYLLLMNSDVMPRRFGWLSELLAAHRRLPDAGAVGPKLLYEDDSIQHAGMRFVRYPLWAGMWVNEHPGKGLTDETGREPIECDAVTAACLLIEAELYRRVGGLSEDYIIGDFEDSDLCLKLLRAGKRNWVVPAVALYHLERQSQNLAGDEGWRTNLSLLNCWTHHRRWDATISDRQAMAMAAP